MFDTVFAVCAVWYVTTIESLDNSVYISIIQICFRSMHTYTYIHTYMQ